MASVSHHTLSNDYTAGMNWGDESPRAKAEARRRALLQ